MFMDTTMFYVLRSYSFLFSAWNNILRNWQTDFFLIPNIKIVYSQFSNPISFSPIFFSQKMYFSKGKYAWQSSLYNAELVVSHALYYTNLYELLVNIPFGQDLNLHKSVSMEMLDDSVDIHEKAFESIVLESTFYSSNKTQYEYFYNLEISGWEYQDVLISAVCHIFENIYLRRRELNGNEKKI